MRIAVFGAGGLGGYLGGRLAQAGEDVALIARGAHLEAIREHGLKVESIKGDFVVQPACATDDPAEVGPMDVVILRVKAWQVAESAEALRRLVGQGTAVVPMQNGVEAPSQLAAVIGAEHVLIGISLIRSFIVAPGIIRHPAEATPNCQLGEMNNERSDRLEKLHKALQSTGISVVIPLDIHAVLWEKFIAACCIGGVGSVTRVPPAVWRNFTGPREMSEAATSEAFAVAQAHGIAVSEAVFEFIRRFRDTVTIEYEGPSMQQDIVDGRPSELEAWTGAVVRLGQELGVLTPVNAFIYYSLLPQELKDRGELSL